MRSLRILIAGALLAGSLPLMAQANWAVTKTMHIGGEGSWDYLTVDSQTHRLFVTRSTHTQVIDGVSGKVLGDITGQVRSHGTAIVPAANRGFITDGGGDGATCVDRRHRNYRPRHVGVTDGTSHLVMRDSDGMNDARKRHLGACRRCTPEC